MKIKIRTKEQQAIDNLKAIINCGDKIIDIEPPLEETCQIALDYITNLQNYYIDNVNKYEEMLVKYSNLQDENERLLHIAKKMHTYIFLNTDNEQEAYDKLGLTEEENIMLGYSGQIIIRGDDNE